MEEMFKILNEVDILAIFVSTSWFGFEFWLWIFWIYAWTCATVLLILYLCLHEFVFLSLFFCVSELVLLCSLNGFSVKFGLVLLNERRFMGLCSYILEHVVFVLLVCCAWFWIFWVCLYCEYVVFDFEFSGYVFDFEFFGFVFDFEFSGCVCIMSMLCLILNFLDLCLIFNFLGGKKPKNFF